MKSLITKSIILYTLLVGILQQTLLAEKNPPKDATRVLSLDETIKLALNQSTEYYSAVNLRENKYWRYRTFQSNYLPQVSLTGTLPDYYRSYVPVTQEDGNIEFKSVKNAISDINLNISQAIGLTGGTIFTSSQIKRFDNLKSEKYEYSGNPFIIGLNQPIVGFNPLLWDKRIAPLQYDESKRDYTEKLEEISLKATEHFFNLMIAQVKLNIASKNKANNDTIYKIAQTRFELGKIAENELLQLELTLMNAEQAVSKAQLDLETSTLKLKIYIGVTDNLPIELVLPESIPLFDVPESRAIEEARKNRSQTIAFERKLIEAKRDIAMARSESGLQANLLVTYGYSNKAEEIGPFYNDPMDQQSLRIGFRVPILDWGRSKSRVKTAMENQKLVKNMIDQDQLNFEQEIYTQVKQFDMLRSQIKITKKSDEVAYKRYEISKSRFLIGKIEITDLNIALQEKDQAKYNYIQSLKEFWMGFYNLRRITLYDFLNDSIIKY